MPFWHQKLAWSKARSGVASFFHRRSSGVPVTCINVTKMRWQQYACLANQILLSPLHATQIGLRLQMHCCGQSPRDRPDIIARVFKMKMDSFVTDVSKQKIFGKYVSFMYNVELQKHSLPHIHLLSILHPVSRIRNSDMVETAVCAEIPPANSPLYHTIRKHMVHGKCGAYNPSAPCVRNGNAQRSSPIHCV